MTPLIFTTFLISLALVDLRHSALRAHYHADTPHPTSTSNTNTGTNDRPTRRRLPPWLHRIVYRYQPYRYGTATTPSGSPRPASPGSSGTPGSPGSTGGESGAAEYYHSKQRELMRMEAEEAFEMRGVVVVGLGLVSVLVGWVVWKGVGLVVAVGAGLVARG